eukprot:CAMPEP_0203963872 /NCGR_PEP_ID=MMETSP0359-20131031/93736_1 /ASSEMBLY_ACC=CAM_ASM_000338 /TAXON_ID=268821 /ORGANISM="Scrippsiella Hangoei, Strain SHTV-5" /LENGTH=36 /DNA_ID= /DNA_START= /DNA_END= /DNA_ORIENTATION=
MALYREVLAQYDESFTMCSQIGADEYLIGPAVLEIR